MQLLVVGRVGARLMDRYTRRAIYGTIATVALATGLILGGSILAGILFGPRHIDPVKHVLFVSALLMAAGAGATVRAIFAMQSIDKILHDADPAQGYLIGEAARAIALGNAGRDNKQLVESLQRVHAVLTREQLTVTREVAER